MQYFHRQISFTWEGGGGGQNAGGANATMGTDMKDASLEPSCIKARLDNLNARTLVAATIV